MRRAVLLVVVAAALLPAASCAWGTSTQTQIARTSAPAPRPPTRVTTAVPFARLYRRSFGVEVVVRCLQKGVTQSCVTRIERTSDLGRKWHDITPATFPRDLFVGSMWFAGPRTAWVTAGDCAAGTEWLYHTTSGGLHWRRARVEARTCNGGATVAADFIDPRIGWLLHVEPTAPFATIERTRSGGRRWSRPIALPSLGAAVEFTDALHGWLGGGGYGLGTLFSTADGGRTWIRTTPAVPRLGPRAHIAYGLPTFFGSQVGVLPITVVRRGRLRIVVDTTGDGGRTWTVAATHRLGRVPRAAPPLLPLVAATSVPSPATWWVLAGRPQTLYVTADGGRSWHASRAALPRVQSLSAINSRVAWLNTFGPVGGSLLRTTDGGRTWQPVSASR